MTTFQIAVFAALMLLLLLVAGLLFLSNVGTGGLRQNSGSSNDSDFDSDFDRKASDDNASRRPSASWSGSSPTVPVESDSASNRNRHDQNGKDDRPPDVITEAGRSVTRPDTIHNRPPITLRSRSKLYHYTALVTKVYDGDTLTADIDLGMNMWAKNQVIRLWKVNTPELRGEEREQGLKVRDEVRSLVLNKYVLVRTILDKRGQDQTGKYGRLLGEILVEEENGELLNINDYLLAQNLAIPMGTDGSAIKPASRSTSPGETGIPMPARSASPRPERVEIDEREWQSAEEFDDEPGVMSRDGRGEVPCSFCGDIRAVDLRNQVVLDCPNCIDGPHPYGGV